MGLKYYFDTSGQTLKDFLSSRPFMIKPNRDEQEQLLNKSFLSDKVIWNTMKEIQANDIPLEIISDGANGSYVLFENTRYKVAGAKILL